ITPSLEDRLMYYLRLLPLLVAATALTACLNSTTLVKVKPDGSGTVEQTTLINTAALKGMMPGAGAQASGPVINREDLERTAARMGKGVRLVSAEKATGDAGFEGTKAIFAFDDINQIQISQDPNMGGSTSGRLSSEPTADDPVKFKLTRGAGTTTLTINYIDKPPTSTEKPYPSPAGGDMPDLTNPMIMNMMKTMFQGFKINIGLEVVGSIVKTNAEYVSGPRITLLEMDVAELLSDEAKLKALQGKISGSPDSLSLSQVRPLLKDIKGIKIDGPSISVEFR
ncbi:MAG: hypothetical protein ACRD1W_06945, partial [Vicinamibacterales bacterium]